MLCIQYIWQWKSFERYTLRVYITYENIILTYVSWVRHRDIHLLTVGRYTYTGDQRFRSINQPPSEDWTLQIKYPQIRDSGIYECQISTTPHISQYIHLQVVGECDLITTTIPSFILYMHLEE
ncbi:zwei Ig domain protein zig-8-like [Aphis craccivora]|uniref:Zwei Ig domain protein zig-8-like n=1 Tax=Aphis craccivora TaxID=307492 RepID=A0A6G0ZCF5_APHCR|nr:zwei Ig domain protein zig-8-like [Aphis craccivora]